MENIIEIKNLSKSFGDIKAVNNLSFNVKKGELFAFLGINGAGKSTTINILCGQLLADCGDVIVDGYNLKNNKNSIKNKIGIVFQNSVLDSALTVFDNLKSRASLYGITGENFNNRLIELSNMLDFKDLLKRPISKLSGGQRRKIDIARALLHKPKILILDEPTTGLDPQTRKLLWNVINEIRKKDLMTVFLTTHYMEEASEADYIIIIDNGKIKAEGSPLKLKNTYTCDYITLYETDECDIKNLGLKYECLNNALKIHVPNTKIATDLIIKYPYIFKDYEITKGKMDDVFLAVTGKNLGGNKE